MPAFPSANAKEDVLRRMIEFDALYVFQIFFQNACFKNLNDIVNDIYSISFSDTISVPDNISVLASPFFVCLTFILFVCLFVYLFIFLCYSFDRFNNTYFHYYQE